MANLSGDNLWIDDTKIIESIKRIGDAVDTLATRTEEKATAMRKAFEETMAGGVNTLVTRLREAKDLIDAMPEAKVAIATSSAEQCVSNLNAGLSELVQTMAKVADVSNGMKVGGDELAQAFNAAGSGSQTLQDFIDKIATPLNNTSDAMKRLTDQMGVLSKADYRKAMGDTQGEAFKSIKNNADALYDTLGRLYALNAQKGVLGLNYNEMDTLEKRIEKIKAALEAVRGDADKSTSPKPFGNILQELQKIDLASAPLHELKKVYKDLIDYTTKSPTNDRDWNNAANEMIRLGARIKEVSDKAKLLPMPMEQFEKAIRKLDRPQLETLRAALQEALNDTNANVGAINAYIKKLAMVNKRYSEDEARGAISFANTARNYNDLKDAIQRLKIVIKQLDPGDRQWEALNKKLRETQKRFDEVRREMGELREETVNIGDKFRSLKTLALQFFSIQAVTGYLKKMAEVHAQMRLQNVALRALLQNKYEADSIFMQVQSMAMQSPFSVMQMTTYTKQLAAYRVESEKLVGTTKMLADVSAGLGVDMQRLILAYGQVKSANYLRATEVRQFTEAGLNIAGELAKYFTEIKGQMVSVAEVMDMISKRAVKFEDVEEIFKRITSAGGLFFDMQKKQSETVYGMMQRIKDAYTIMMDEIGQGNQGAIKNVLQLIREMMANWRSILPYLKAAVAYIVAFYATKNLFGLIKGLSLVGPIFQNIASKIGVATIATRELTAAQMALGWSNLIGVLLSLGVAVYSLVTKTDKLHESLNQIREEILNDASESIARLRLLLSTVNDVNRSYTEQHEALEDIKRSYGEIFTKQELEINNIKALGENWEKTEQRMRSYYNAQLAEQSRAAIEKNWEEQFNKFLKNLAGRESHMKKLIPAYESSYGEYVARDLSDRLKMGLISVENAWKEWVDRINKYYGTNVESYLFDKELRTFRKLKTEVRKYNNEMSYIRVLDIDTLGENKQITEYNKELARRVKLIESYRSKLEEVRALQSKGLEIDPKLVSEINALRASIIDNPVPLDLNLQPASYNRSFIDFFSVDRLKEVSANLVTINNEIDNVTASMFEGFKTYNGSWGDLDFMGKAKMLENVQAAMDNVAASTDLQRRVDMIKKQLSQMFDIDISIFDNIKVGANDATSDVVKNLKSIKEQWTENVKAFDIAAKAFTENWKAPMGVFEDANAYAAKTVQITKEQRDAYSEALPLLELFANLLGATLAKENNGRQTDPWIKRIDLMLKVNAEYEKLLKYYDKETAKAKILTGYASAAREIFGSDSRFGDINTWLGFDKKATAAMLDEIIGMANDKVITMRAETLKKLQEDAAKLHVEIEIEDQQKKLEDFKKDVDTFFDNYELTKTIGELGLDVDITYMVGGKPMTLSQLRKSLEDAYNNAKIGGHLGKEAEEAYKSYLKKITDLENKAQIERIKNYNKYMLEAMSARGKIMMESMTEQNKILESQDMDAFTKSLAMNQVKKKEIEDLAKQTWEDFKNTDLYIDMFENLQYATKESLDYMIERLEGLKSSLKGLPADQVRAIVKELDKLREQRIAVSDPFSLIVKNFKPALEAMRSMNKWTDEYNRKSVRYSERKQYRDDTADELVRLQMEYDTKKKLSDVDVAELNSLADQINDKKLLLLILDDELKTEKEVLDTLKEQINAGKLSKEALAGGFGLLSKGLDGISDIAQNLKTTLPQIFGFSSESFEDTMDDISAVMDAVGELSSGVESIMKGDIIGGIVKTITGPLNMLASLAAIGDRKKQRQIEKMIERVETLAKTYDNLKESISKAYEFNDYKMGVMQAKSNLEAQIDAYQRMLALEKAKKKQDNDALKEYEDKLNELRKEYKELSNEQTKALGGFGSDTRFDAAEAFVDTWLAAYKETGDGLDALSEQWDEYIENLLKKQAAYRIVGKRMETFFNQIDNMANAHSEMSMKEILDNIMAVEGSILERANEELKEFFDYFGWTGAGDLLLSDLQKGIQNITEAQAAALESITNSIRFGVWKQVDLLTDLVAAIRQQYSLGDSPMLNEVRSIRRLVSNIDANIASVIRKAPVLDGKPYVRVN